MHIWMDFSSVSFSKQYYFENDFYLYKIIA